jgi:hypothetical protein
MARLSQIVKWIKDAWDLYALLTGLGLIPTAAVIYAIVEQQPISVILLYAFASLGYGIVVYLEARPLLAALRERKGPRIIFDRTRTEYMYGHSEGNPSRPLYFVVEAWFVNQPTSRFPNTDSVAHQVTARVEIERNGRSPLAFFGLWTGGGHPDNAGFRSTMVSSDILPNGLPAKVVIALKYRGEERAYAYAGENLESSSAGRNVAYAIEPGRSRVSIRLAGIGVNKSFAFILDNDGESAVLAFDQPE